MMSLEQVNYIEKLKKQREIFERKARTLLFEGATRHSHTELADYFKCFHCMIARKNQLEARHKMGLSNSRNYMRWRKRNTINYNDKLRRAQENIYKF